MSWIEKKKTLSYNIELFQDFKAKSLSYETGLEHVINSVSERQPYEENIEQKESSAKDTNLSLIFDRNHIVVEVQLQVEEERTFLEGKRVSHC